MASYHSDTPYFIEDNPIISYYAIPLNILRWALLYSN